MAEKDKDKAVKKDISSDKVKEIDDLLSELDKDESASPFVSVTPGPAPSDFVSVSETPASINETPTTFEEPAPTIMEPEIPSFEEPSVPSEPIQEPTFPSEPEPLAPESPSGESGELPVSSDLSFLDDLGKGTTPPSTSSEKSAISGLDMPSMTESGVTSEAEIPSLDSFLSETPAPESVPTIPEDTGFEPETPITPSLGQEETIKRTASQEDVISLTDDEAIKVQSKISTFKPNLRKIAKRVIVNEEMSVHDLKTLLDYILIDESEEVIRQFIETKLHISIREDILPGVPEIKKVYKPSLVDIIQHDFIPILRLAIPVLAILIVAGIMVLKPIGEKYRAKRLIEKGVVLIKTDNTDKINIAEDNLKKAFTIRNDYYDAYLKYGDAYLNIKKFNNAEIKYKDFISANPESVAGYFHLGELYKQQELFDTAIDEYQKVLHFSKNNIQALDEIARIYFYKKKDKEKALDIYKKIINKNPKNVQAHYGLLSLYIADNDLDNVETEHYQVLKNAPKKLDKKRLTELAQFYLDYDTKMDEAQRTDMFNKAEDTLKRILGQDDRYSEAYYQFARLYRKRHDLKRAAATINEAIDYKHEAKYYNFKGELYLLENKLNLAIEEFDKVIDMNPDYYKAYYNLANVNYYDLGNYGRAKELYERAVDKLGDKQFDLDYNLGYIYYKEFDYLKANQYFIKARETMNQNDPALNLAIGNTYLRLGKNDLAIAEYLDAIDFYKERYGEYPVINITNPEMVEAMKLLSAAQNNLGVSYLGKDDKQAVIYFWKSLESAKKLGFANENPYARANLTYVLQSKNKVITEPQVEDEIKNSLVSEPYEKITF